MCLTGEFSLVQGTPWGWTLPSPCRMHFWVIELRSCCLPTSTDSVPSSYTIGPSGLGLPWLCVLLLWSNILTKATQERVYPGLQFEGTVLYGGEAKAAGGGSSWQRHMDCQEEERGECWCPAHCLFFKHPRRPVQGMLLLTFRVMLHPS